MDSLIGGISLLSYECIKKVLFFYKQVVISSYFCVRTRRIENKTQEKSVSMPCDSIFILNEKEQS